MEGKKIMRKVDTKLINPQVAHILPNISRRMLLLVLDFFSEFIGSCR